MTTEEIQKKILKILQQIAPEVKSDSIPSDQPFRELLELDSMDFLHFVVGLNREFLVPIPESDYRLLETLDQCVRYVEQKQKAGTGIAKIL